MIDIFLTQWQKLLAFSFIAIILVVISACNNPTRNKSISTNDSINTLSEVAEESDDLHIKPAVLFSPGNPAEGALVRVIVTGNKSVLKAKIKIKNSLGEINSSRSVKSDSKPYWRIDEFIVGNAGEYNVFVETKSNVENLKFNVGNNAGIVPSNSIWKTEISWDYKTESLYSAWISVLFHGVDERTSWAALHEITENKERNFLYNHLSLGEDNNAGKVKVIMEPDCADNPYFLRAYFAWKLGLPFGYHEADRGGLGMAPRTGRWFTNEIVISKSNPVQKFNSFMRMVMNSVHSGSARASLSNENSDYYPVELNAEAIRPGAVYADPYGHTFIIIGKTVQTKNQSGVLLSVDAQPDGTVGIKRFWKGNFLFNTNEKEVIGEPGFKAFRPIILTEGKLRLLSSEEINANSDFLKFSLQQKGMASNEFYNTMERIINPAPLDPETAMLDLINALHEQLLVRVNSVNNGENYMKSRPGTIIPMPGRAAGVFQTGGLWEDYSTPNRDLRLLIAIDAVIDFPEKVKNSPDDYRISILNSPEKIRDELQALLNKKVNELTISYIKSDGSEQILTIAEILKRRNSFEMAYNPNDGPEIRWGAPENSEERSSCKRKAPAVQLKTMNDVRVWFQKRLHPPT